jgi:hypothetical protein
MLRIPKVSGSNLSLEIDYRPDDGGSKNLCRSVSIRLHSSTSQKTVIFIPVLVAVRTWKLSFLNTCIHFSLVDSDISGVGGGWECRLWNHRLEYKNNLYKKKFLYITELGPIYIKIWRKKLKRKFGTVTTNRNCVYVKILSISRYDISITFQYTRNSNIAYKTHSMKQSHWEADRRSDGQ